jgi:hypothetical protein
VSKMSQLQDAPLRDARLMPIVCHGRKLVEDMLQVRSRVKRRDVVVPAVIMILPVTNKRHSISCAYDAVRAMNSSLVFCR